MGIKCTVFYLFFPFQGMEDVVVLEQMLNQYPGDLLKAFNEYSLHRAPDAKAICDLAMYNYVEV